jgi:hypothetical protein
MGEIVVKKDINPGIVTIFFYNPYHEPVRLSYEEFDQLKTVLREN